MNKLLIISPIPPPITGQSLAAELLIKNLPKNYLFETVNLSKKLQKVGTVI